MKSEIERFNWAATELQQSEFRVPRTPAEWQRIHKDPPKRDYDRLFSAVSPLVEAFVTASPTERSEVASQLSPDALGILRTFAYSTSVVAVRRQLSALVAQGLASLAILGAVDDPRDLSYYLATAYYSAAKLGLDTQKLFSEGTSLCNPGFLRNYMQGFPMLPDAAYLQGGI